jgi:hypothetical protein
MDDTINGQAGQAVQGDDVSQDGATDPAAVSAVHRKLVMEVHDAMTPANCRRENRLLATRMKNMYESCRLIMWLWGIDNDENAETKKKIEGIN